VAAFEQMNLRLRDIARVGMRAFHLERRIVSPPQHERRRPMFAQVALPLRITRDVGSIVVEQIGLDVALTRPREERELVGPAVRVVALRVRATPDMAQPRRFERKQVGPQRRFVRGTILPERPAGVP